MSRIKFHFTPLLFLFGLCLSTSVSAANTDDPEWYQVELILFAYETEASPSDELWRDDFNPVYPENTVILKPFNTQEENTDPQNSTEVKNADITTESLDVEAIPEIDLDKDPYILLPDYEWQLSNKAKRLDRTSGIRLLEHIAWRQPVSERKKSQPILIQAGEQYGLSFEVEGLVSISENRYLHVDMDLLFSKYNLELFDNTLDWSSLSQESPIIEPGQAASLSENDNRSASTGNVEGIFFQDTTQQYQREYTTELKHIRRVRAEELHYIDHPLFGVLVKITPYELPDPAMEIKELDLSILPIHRPLPNGL